MLINIYKANNSKKESRYKYIEFSRENIEVVRLLFRLCKDLKIIGMKGFVALNIQVEDLSKQLASWQKHTAGVHMKD